jgi:hypothetical protein
VKAPRNSIFWPADQGHARPTRKTRWWTPTGPLTQQARVTRTASFGRCPSLESRSALVWVRPPLPLPIFAGRTFTPNSVPDHPNKRAQNGAWVVATPYHAHFYRGRKAVDRLVDDATPAKVAQGGKNQCHTCVPGDETDYGLHAEEIDAALDPTYYLGSTGTFIARALSLYCEEVQT